MSRLFGGGGGSAPKPGTTSNVPNLEALERFKMLRPGLEELRKRRGLKPLRANSILGDAEEDLGGDGVGASGDSGGDDGDAGGISI